MSAQNGRTADAVAAMLAAAVVTSQFVAGRASRDALFLANLDTTALPAAVFAAAALSVVLSIFGARALPAVSTAALVPLLFVASALLFVIEWLLIAGPSANLGATVLYLHVSGLGPILGSGFWLVASERFDPRTARTLFVRMTAAGTVGGLVGGVLADRVSAVAGAGAVLPVLAVLNVAAGWQIRRLARSIPSAPGMPAQGLVPVPAWSSVGSLTRVVYLRRLAAVVLLGSLGATLVDYAFKVQAMTDLGEGDALMRFFAIYYGGVNVLVFAVQVLSNRLATERLGLTGAVATPSIGLFIGCGAGLIAPGLAGVTVARGAESVFRASVFRSAYEVFFTPLPPDQKRAAKSIIDVAFDRIGEAAGAAIIALVLLSAASHARPIVLALAMCCALGAGLTARGLARLYIGALERRLHDRALELQLSGIHDHMTRTLMLQSLTAAGVTGETPLEEASLRSTHRRSRPPLDADLLQILALRSGNRSRMLRVLDPANPLTARVVSHVIPLLESSDTAPAAMRALEKVADKRVGELTDALLDRDVPVVVRRRIARVLGQAATQRAVDGLVLALEDDQLDVRRQSGRSLLHVRHRAPELRLEAERVFACARRELQRPGGAPVDDAGVAHVFTLLSLVLPEAPLRIAHRSIENDDPVLRGTALEYLAGVLPADLRDALWSLLERPSRPAR